MRNRTLSSEAIGSIFVSLCPWHIPLNIPPLFHHRSQFSKKSSLKCRKKYRFLTILVKNRYFLWSECNYRISENTDISTVCWLSARGIYSKNSKWREQRRPTGQRAALSCKSLKGTLPIQSHSCLTQLHFHLNSDEIVLQCAGGICILFRAQLLGI